MDQQKDNGPRDGVEELDRRPARVGETGTTRFGMEDGDDTDGKGTGGMVEKKDAGGGEPESDGPSSGVTR
jgi:hypothetical protein